MMLMGLILLTLIYIYLLIQSWVILFVQLIFYLNYNVINLNYNFLNDKYVPTTYKKLVLFDFYYFPERLMKKGHLFLLKK